MKYVQQLSQKEQDYITARLNAFFTAEGLSDTELSEAIEDALNSKLDDLEDVLGNTLYNNCVECEESWNALEHLGIEDIHLDDTDYENLRNYGQIYCLCEDCDGNSESVLKITGGVSL